MKRVAAALLGWWVCGAGMGARAQAPEPLQLSGTFQGVHDPSIIQEGKTFYVFATGPAFAAVRPGGATPPVGAGGAPPPPGTGPSGQLPIRCSEDLLTWRRCGQVFAALPEWIKTSSPATRDLWAPDISYFGGLYHLYYAYSVFGKNTSGIALATNVTLDEKDPRYKWEDRGLVLQSLVSDDFNAIDPNVILDEQGVPWMALGSFWTGIKMRRLDAATGKLAAEDHRSYALAERAHPVSEAAGRPDLPPDSQAVEAPFVLRHGGFYYLFVSWDLCCKGAKSTYREMVGRSKAVTGPYVDREGKPMSAGGGTQVLTATSRWVGPGGASLLHVAEGARMGEDLIVFHAYDAVTGRPALQISPIGWVDGWPAARVLAGDSAGKVP